MGLNNKKSNDDNDKILTDEGDDLLENLNTNV